MDQRNEDPSKIKQILSEKIVNIRYSEVKRDYINFTDIVNSINDTIFIPTASR